MDTLLTMYDYLWRISPGLVLMALIFYIIKPNSTLRIVLYITAFVLMRDVMTPLGLWSLGGERGALWIRLSPDPFFLILFGTTSLLVVTGLYIFDKENRKHLIWFRNSKLPGFILGVSGAILVVLPFLFLYRNIDISLRGGSVSTSLLIPIFLFAILGNLFEEVLFRGYVLGYLKTKQGIIVAGISSGVIFAFCHIFLAITVTDIGSILLIFTLWEGIIAGLVGVKYGIIPATITHGGAIFLLSSGLL